MTTRPRDSTVSTCPVISLALVAGVVDVHVVRRRREHLRRVRVVDRRCRRRSPARSCPCAGRGRTSGPGSRRRSRSSAAGRCARRPRPGAAGPSGVSTPGSPLGIFEKSPRPSSFCPLKQNGQWSVETTDRSSVRSPRHSAAWCSRGPQRRGADVLGALEVRAGRGRRWTGTGTAGRSRRRRCSPRRGPSPTSASASSRRQVDDVERARRHLRQLDRPVRGLGLQQRVAHVAVVARVGLARGRAPARSSTSMAMPFSACIMISPPLLGARLHGAQDLAVVAVEDAGVGHEQLEAGDALADQDVHLLERALVDVGDDHVERRSRSRTCRRPWRARRRGPPAARRPIAGWRSRRSWWCRPRPRRGCRSRRCRRRTCRRTASPCGCARRRRRG